MNFNFLLDQLHSIPVADDEIAKKTDTKHVEEESNSWVKLILDMRNHSCVEHDQSRETTNQSQNQNGCFGEKLFPAKLDDQEYSDAEVEDCSKDEEDHGDVDQLLPPDLYLHPSQVHLPL